MRVSWTDRKTTEEVLQLAGMKRSMMKTIIEKQLKFLGHINRENGCKRSYSVEKLKVKQEKIMFCGKKMKEKEAGVDKEHHNYTSSLNAFAIKKQMPNNRFIQLAGDRVEWRTMIVDACTRPNT
ncbi:hypothetical protein PoB_000230000 [Plakobranchus ocellatus]|uniref:Uncharacterized protein n=1 Tax=Plakobranchus ocellatus TaxID=259542 RepID=A0AAV3XYS7_9GAST|nr:hypothetical protein PoB_000230000 [Plakobranchus ocellatus]